MASSTTPASGSVTHDPKFTNIEYMDTVEAYDQWAEVYDTDGNFLQALDTLEMQTLLPSFLSLVGTASSSKDLEKCKFIDLGCGTGRNTLALQRAAPHASVVGLEPSRKMLDIARNRVAAQIVEQQQTQECTQVSFEQYDVLVPGDSGVPSSALSADGVISTLVLEHLPVSAFFTAAATMLGPGGILLLTNMHPEMGGISQAGFVHPVTKVKIRPTSYAHTIEEVVRAAGEAGFEMVGEMKQVGVDAELAKRLGVRATKWVGVKVWFGGCFRKM